MYPALCAVLLVFFVKTNAFHWALKAMPPREEHRMCTQQAVAPNQILY